MTWKLFDDEKALSLSDVGMAGRFGVEIRGL
jgi:hypothetical protein